MSRSGFHFQPIDAALLLMTVIWGSNFTLVKLAVRDIPELPFNSLRLLIASATFLLALAAREGEQRLTGVEWRRIAELGIVGHFGYQLCFLGAVARTTVANNSLQKLGGSRTAVYSNVTPLVAMVAAAIWLGEPLTLSKLAGAVAVIAGVAVTRFERRIVPPPLEAL